MRNLAVALLMTLVLPRMGAALETDDLLAIVAMPLAVAAVADVADVPARDVVNLVTALNRANVPPPQFVEVVRYAPMAIVDQRLDPPFVTYVDSRVDQGIVGEPLVVEIQERYRPYGVERFDYAEPRLVVVQDEPVLPSLVVDRFGLDPLALVAMPLAVAAVSELTNVPMQDFVSFLAALNRADVPPVQFVELVRYSPVVLLDDELRPGFIRYATSEIDDLDRYDYALALAQQLRSHGADELDVVRIGEPVYVVDREYLPAVVRNHPHVGPPGQLKKELGLQTGAEVVHGTQPGRRGDDRVPTRVVERSVDRDRGVDREVRGNSGRRADRAEQPRPSRGNQNPGPPAARRDDQGRGARPAAAAPDEPRGNASGNRGRGNENKGNASQGNPGKGKGKG